VDWLQTFRKACPSVSFLIKFCLFILILLYNLFLFLYGIAIRIVSFFSPKAKLWIDGRKDILATIERAFINKNEQRIWIHCASLGEFEQGRPVIEALRKQYPETKIVLTFFSPSGYEIRKNYEGADYVFYLPMDGFQAANRFLDAVNPKLVLFVKYEFWYHYLHEVKVRKIPTLLIAAAFRKEQIFFKNYGGFFREILKCFSQILVQDDASKNLLAGIGFDRNVSVAGDTRYDRVAEIASAARPLPEIDLFKGGSKLFIGGSTWPADEQIVQQLLPQLPADWKMIIAPHEIDAAHLKSVQVLFGEQAILFSEWKLNTKPEKRVLIIDNIGMLSSLYRYGDIAFVGGGFNKGGIHNVLEPAIFGLPVLTGPVYHKFVEAVALVDAGFVFPISDSTAAAIVLNALFDDSKRNKIKLGLDDFMQSHIGATDKILHLIEAQRWLD